MKKIEKSDSIKTTKTRVVRVQSQNKDGNLVDQTILINEDMSQDESIKNNFKEGLHNSRF